MDFLIDSGAEINVLSEGHWQLLKRDFEAGDSIIYDVEPGSTKRIMAFAGASPLEVTSTFSSWIEIPGTTKPKEFAKFFVLQGGKKSLLGQQTAIRMRLLKVGLSVDNVTASKDLEAVMPFPSVPGDAIDPWEIIAIDFNGPYARYGGILILVVVDCYSRHLSASVVKTTNFASTEKVLETMFGRFGKPKAIKVDNGPPFNGSEFGKYTTENGIRAIFSTPLHPQQNGMVERYMQVVNKAMQIANTEGTDFKQQLADAIRAHNSATHRVTQKSPDEIMFGRKLRRNLPIIGGARVEIDRQTLQETDRLQKNHAKTSEDKKRQAKESKFEVGDVVVLLKTSRGKGEPRFDPAPYRITECRQGDFTIEGKDGKIMKRNVTHLKRLHKRVNDDKADAPEKDRPSEIFQQPQQTSKRIGKLQSLPELRRSTRMVKQPKHYDMYVRLLEELMD